MKANGVNVVTAKELSSNTLAGVVEGLLLKKYKMIKTQKKEEKTA